MHYPIDLDTLPESWEKGYVGDFAVEIRPGFASGQHNKEGRGIPHIRPFNIDRRGTLDLTQIKSVAPDADAKRLHSGDVLFNNTNSPELIGKTSFVAAAGDWGFSNHMTRVVFPEAVSPKFAAYQLHYLWMRGYFLHNCVKHVNQASISSTTLARAVPFVKPPRGQQDNIVSEIEKQFSRLDEAVANLKRGKANLKRYKAAVLKAAVEGALVPIKNRQTTKIGEVAELVTKGSSPNWQGFAYADTGVVFVRSQNVGWGNLDLSDVAHLPPAFNEKERKSVLRTGDVLLNIVGASIGRVAVVTPEIEGGNVNQAVAVIRLNKERMLPKYLMLNLLSPGTQAAITLRRLRLQEQMLA